MAHPVEALAHLTQEIEPSLPVIRVEINVLAPITACRGKNPGQTGMALT
jgi:hypothetical protein